MSAVSVNRDDTHIPCLDSAADIISTDPHHSDVVQALAAIGLEHNAGAAPRCAHQQQVTVFPLISSLSRADQIRYTQLLRGITRSLGVALFGSTAQILAIVHQAAQAQSIDTHGSFPGHDTDMTDRWPPGMFELTDMALQSTMRKWGDTVSGHMSPISSVTSPGRPSCSG